MIFSNYFVYKDFEQFTNFATTISNLNNEFLDIDKELKNIIYYELVKNKYNEININKNNYLKFETCDITELNIIIINKAEYLNIFIFFFNNNQGDFMDIYLLINLLHSKCNKIIVIINLKENDLNKAEEIKYKYNNYLNELLSQIKREYKIFILTELDINVVIFSNIKDDGPKYLDVKTAKRLLNKSLNFTMNLNKKDNTFLNSFNTTIINCLFNKATNKNNYFSNTNDLDIIFYVKNKYALGNKCYLELEFLNKYKSLDYKYNIIKENYTYGIFPNNDKINNYNFIINRDIYTKDYDNKDINNIAMLCDLNYIYTITKNNLLYIRDIDNNNFNKINNKIVTENSVKIICIIYLIADIDISDINYIVKFNDECSKIKNIKLNTKYFFNINLFEIELDNFLFFDANYYDHSSFFLENIRYNRIGRGYLIK